MQVRRLAGQLEPVPGPDEVGLGLRLVLPPDDDFPVLERAHPGVEVEGFRAGEALGGCRACGRICSAIRREARKVAAALVRLAATMETGAGPPVYVRG